MFFWLIACTQEPSCGAGFELQADGMCYPTSESDPPATTDTAEEDDPATVDDVLANLDDCELMEGDGRLDFATGCADGACPDMSYDEMVAALGEEPDCYVYWYKWDTYEGGALYCTWSNGVEASFDDDDMDGIADAGSTNWSVGVDLPFDGSTADGLGLDASMSCFVEVLGTPDAVDFELVDDEWVPSWYHYDAWGLYVSDWTDGFDYVPDGWPDSFSLYGADDW